VGADRSDAIERVASRRLLGFLLVAAAALAEVALADHHFDEEVLRVIGTHLAADPVDRMRAPRALDVFLEVTLVVGVALVGDDLPRFLEQPAVDERPRGLEALV